ncbi:hypothetical protein [Ferruginibacter sp.]|uniref:hypothetical protein n=1 Tax=Ferruginibacter sp. TaxID=1940288 RepID=UPI002657FE50|nr:hypothetical protein [Ferruginibacter sp.]
MRQKKQNIFFSLTKIVALLFYLPFFLVQIFINHDSISTGKYAPAVYTKATTSALVVVGPGNNKTTGKVSSIRLNKRFQPATTPFCVPVSFEIQAYITPETSFGNYLNPALVSPHLFTYSLRGPPAVV